MKTTFDISLQDVFPELRYLAERFHYRTASLSINTVNYISELYLNQHKDQFLQDSSIDLSELLAYIERSHEYYLNRKLPEIEQTLNTLYFQLENNAILTLIKKTRELVLALSIHIQEEEMFLLPYIRQLLKIKNGSTNINSTILTCEILEENMGEHLQIELTLALLVSELKSTKRTSESMVVDILITQIEFLSNDLKMHSKIEDRLLIPRAIELQSNLKKIF
jgi:regulator of cell morphogenesis and NO signaling